MKLRKALSIIVAVAMIGTLALSAGATTSISLEGSKGYEYVALCGNEVDPISNDIDQTIIAKVKLTISFEDDADCIDDKDNSCEKGECVGFSWNSNTTSFKEKKFCITESNSYEIDLKAAGYPKMKSDTDVDDYLKVGAATWGIDAKGTLKVEVIGTDGKVLKLGQKELEGASTTAPSATNAPGSTTTTAAATGGSAPKTGVADVLALGGMAVLAIGAVVISRKRK